MQLDTEELGVLADMLNAEKMSRLEKQLSEEQERADYWQNRCQQAEMMSEAAMLQASFLKNYIHLSTEKITTFVKTLSKVEQVAFLRMFVECTMPEELRMQSLQLVNKAMPMPSVPEHPTPTIYNFNEKVNTVAPSSNINNYHAEES